MAKWLDPITEDHEQRLKTLCRAVRRIKPGRWSVVWKTNEISIRPSDRSIGRFSVTYLDRRGFSVMFYSRASGIWTKTRHFGDDSRVADEIVRWAVEVATDPTTEDRAG
jgi:hypothetical protein